MIIAGVLAFNVWGLAVGENELQLLQLAERVNTKEWGSPKAKVLRARLAIEA